VHSDESEENRLSETIARIKQGESQNTEFKQDFPETARNLAEDIAAFATSNEGIIYLGVTDKGEVLGLNRPKAITEAAWRDSIQKRTQGISELVAPRIRVETSFLIIAERQVCEVFVPKGEEPVYYVANVPYLRDLTVSRRADPQEVKELHRKFFQGIPTPSNVEQQPLFELVNQLSDLDLLLSDVERRRSDDLRQWRYDIDATAKVLQGLSTEPAAKSLGADNELRELAGALSDLHATRLYIDGGVSWRFMLENCQNVREKADMLLQRTMKRLPFAPPPKAELMQLADSSLRLLEDGWLRAQEYRQPGRVSGFRSEVRRLSFVFARLGNHLRIIGDAEAASLAAQVANLLRSIDTQDIFQPGIGRNPVELMQTPIQKAIALARDLVC